MQSKVTNMHSIVNKLNSRMKTIYSIGLLVFGISGYVGTPSALTFPLPASGDVVGEIQTATVRRGESLGELGRRFDIGVYEMIEANPGLDPWVPTPGATVVIPSQFILPPGPRKGIVLNLAEMRLYYYHPNKALVSTFPIGVGKKGWSTPLTVATITGKKQNPTWTPPTSIRQEHIRKGDKSLPAVVPAGPNNPLGLFAFYTSIPSILIHGSNRPGGVGVRSSHGCIRLLPEDVEAMYYMVPIGTSVRIIHEPFKVGFHKDKLYLEAHQPMTEARYQGSDSMANLVRAIERVIPSGQSHLVNWTSAKLAAKKVNGCPTRID